MPVTFTDVASESPAAPYVLVSVGRPDGTTLLADVPAKVDSGADQTILPTRLAGPLNLDVIDRREFEGLGGQKVSLEILRALVTIRDCPPVQVDVASSDGEPYILLGRDVLNDFRIILDGPNGKLTIE